MEGTIKWFNREKGYGFILGEDGKEYFVHHSALGEQNVKDDDKVSFEVVDTDRGTQAQNVKLLGGSKASAPAEEASEDEEPVEEELADEESVEEESEDDEAETDEEE